MVDQHLCGNTLLKHMSSHIAFSLVKYCINATASYLHHILKPSLASYSRRIDYEIFASIEYMVQSSLPMKSRAFLRPPCKFDDLGINASHSLYGNSNIPNFVRRDREHFEYFKIGFTDNVNKRNYMSLSSHSHTIYRCLHTGFMDRQRSEHRQDVIAHTDNQHSIVKLKDKREYIPQIASTYLQEWGWHFRDEWNITTHEDMVKDIEDNFLEDIYLIFSDKQYIGTVSIVDSDLKSHMHLRGWITCLYVTPECRNRGYASYILKYVIKYSNRQLHAWCYTEKERDLYCKLGFQPYETIEYDGKTAWILVVNAV